MGRDDGPKRDPIIEAFDVSEQETVVEDERDLPERPTVVDDGYIADLRSRLESASSPDVAAEDRDSEVETEKAILSAFQDRTTEKLESEIRGREASGSRQRESVPPPRARRDPQAIYVLCGPDAGRSFPLEDSQVKVGRGKECDLTLSDSSVSRVHLILTRRQDGWYFEDQRSENGTYLDGQWARKGKLGSGEPLELGRTMLVLEGVEE